MDWREDWLWLSLRGWGLSSILSCCHHGAHECPWQVVSRASTMQRGKCHVLVNGAPKSPFSSQLVMKPGSIGESGTIDHHRPGDIILNLTGRLCKCGGINSWFHVRLKDLEKWQNNWLLFCHFVVKLRCKTHFKKTTWVLLGECYWLPHTHVEHHGQGVW